MQLLLDISKDRSSLISKLEYDDELYLLKVYLRYKDDCLWYSEVFPNHFDEFYHTQSIGKYYLHFIKPNFKQLKVPKMSEERKIKTKNEASSEKRFIKMSICVDDIIKEWLIPSKDGKKRYMNFTLHMLPDGELDRYGNLGMLTQDVPKFIYDKEKEDKVAKKDLTKGPILGNGAELDYGGTSSDVKPGDSATSLYEVADNLPF